MFTITFTFRSCVEFPELQHIFNPIPKQNKSEKVKTIFGKSHDAIKKFKNFRTGKRHQ